jgi:hypothetical protein
VTVVALLFIVLAVVIGLGALIAALAVRRALRNVGQSMQHLDARLTERGSAITERLDATRVSLATVNATAERALSTLGNADDRMDRMRVDLTAKRYASDRLRVRLIDGQLSLARVRELIRLLVRLDKLRREFG